MSGSVSLRSREGRDDQLVVKRDNEEFLSVVAFFTFPGVPEDKRYIYELVPNFVTIIHVFASSLLTVYTYLESVMSQVE